MTCKNLRTALAFAVMLGPALWTSSPARAEVRYGTAASPLTGRRYETMRALAHYLDERAQSAIQQADSLGRLTSPTERKVRDSLKEFAQMAAGFHQRIDDYVEKPWDIPGEVEQIDGYGQRLAFRLRQFPVLSRIYQDWQAVLDVSGKMRQVLAGADVQVPKAHPGFGDYDRDYRPFLDPQQPYGWRQGTLEQFRTLARELDDVTSRAHNDAERYLPKYPGYARHPEELHRFNEETRDLRQRADANQVDPRELRPIVDRLREDARRTDQEMRSSNIFPQVWDEWQRAVSILDQMSRLVTY